MNSIFHAIHAERNQTTGNAPKKAHDPSKDISVATGFSFCDGPSLGMTVLAWKLELDFKS